MAYNEDSSASGHDEPWIQWFCGLKGHEMFCEVERAYIEDGFNLYGLRACVPNFSDCLDLILDRIGPDDSDDSHLTQSACTLYGLIHARYIITAHGLDAMYNKYASKEFGTCPLVQCGGQPVLPVGLTDEVGADTVKVFCPKCQCVYHPPPSRSRGGNGAVDGASFGTTFPHLFLMTFSNLVPDSLSSYSAYVPRVFGFRVHQSARQRNGATSMTSLPHISYNVRGGTKSGTEQGSGNTPTVPPDGTSTGATSSLREAEQESHLSSETKKEGGQPQQLEPGIKQTDENNSTTQTHKSPLISTATSTLEHTLGSKARSAIVNSPMPGGNKTRDGDSATLEGVACDGNKSTKQPNSSHIKRKSKGSGGPIPSMQMEGNGKLTSENGDVPVKGKPKRQKRPGNGIT